MRGSPTASDADANTCANLFNHTHTHTHTHTPLGHNNTTTHNNY